MTQKVLITGSEGFIGKHLKKHLEASGDYELIPFDIKLNCFHDVTNPTALKELMESSKPNIIIHLAANPDISRSIAYAGEDLALNAAGTIHLLEAIKGSDIDLFVFASTAQVYGEPQHEKMDENHPINPKSPYAISKRTAEMYCEYYHQIYDVPITIFRFFNIYGPDQPDTVVVPSLLRKIHAAKGRLDMFGSKEDSRDFVYVKDLCDAIERAIRKKPAGEKINLGSGKETTIYELARTIACILGKDIEFSYPGDVETAKVSRMCANADKAKHLLSWEAKTTLQEGLKEVAKRAGYIEDV